MEYLVYRDQETRTNEVIFTGNPEGFVDAVLVPFIVENNDRVASNYLRDLNDNSVSYSPPEAPNISTLPDVEKLLQLILADNRLKLSVKSALADLKDKLAPVVGNKAYVQAFWADFKSDSVSYAWLNPKVAAIVEILALECNIPLVDSAPDPSTVADVDSFVATVLSSQEVAPYLIEMSQAMTILSAQIGDTSKIPLMQAFWSSLKVKTSMDANAIKVIEDAAHLYNIPIVDLGS